MAAPWFENPDAFGAWAGAAIGVLGGLVGTLGGVTGWLAPKGVGRRLIVPLWWTTIALGALLLVIGLAAVVLGQPYAIWYPLVLGGGLIALLAKFLLPTVYARYADADERRRAAAELRGGASPQAPPKASPSLGTPALRGPAFIGFFLVLFPTLVLLQQLGGRSDIWWTPIAMAPTLDRADGRVVVLVGGVPLAREIEAGRIQRVTETGSVPLGPADVKVRLNNWDAVRASRLPTAAGLGALIGIGLALCGFGTWRAIEKRVPKTGSRVDPAV
jgi:hypothetical protein